VAWHTKGVENPQEASMPEGLETLMLTADPLAFGQDVTSDLPRTVSPCGRPEQLKPGEHEDETTLTAVDGPPCSTSIEKRGGELAQCVIHPWARVN
jgi:hypothetical protein